MPDTNGDESSAPYYVKALHELYDDFGKTRFEGRLWRVSCKGTPRATSFFWR